MQLNNVAFVIKDKHWRVYMPAMSVLAELPSCLRISNDNTPILLWSVDNGAYEWYACEYGKLLTLS